MCAAKKGVTFAKMSPPKPSLHLLFFFFLLLIQPFGAQSQEGFISLDCGLEGSSGYKDKITGINYTGDSQYTTSGKSHAVSDNPFELQYETLRSFPNGTRNCYSLSPVQSGRKYLVRAGFYYGNYDGQNLFPAFDIYIGVNFWTSVGMGSDGSSVVEIITMPRRSTIEVCLVNTNGGTPFISALELRPLLDYMYPSVNEFKSLIKEYRWNYGSSGQLRYPKDPYDRFWIGVNSGFDLLNTTQRVESKAEDPFQVPSEVIQTAITIAKTDNYLTSRAIQGKPGAKGYIVLHFAELLKLNPANESRKLDIFGVDGNSLLFAKYSPPYLTVDHKEISTVVVGESGTYTVAIRAANSSTRSYMINALESFVVRSMNESQTVDSDVLAIEDVKKAFRLTRNWESDPCSPKQLIWEGVGCSYEASTTARITSLNLSSWGLEGEIPSSIGNLTALTSLDLSNNNLSGSIPEILGSISSLKNLYLSGNEAIGNIPQSLCDKVSTGTLSISGGKGECRISKKSNKTIIIAITVSISVIFLIILAVLWICFRKSRSISSKDEKKSAGGEIEGVMGSKKDGQFTFAEIIRITSNFKQEIGKGGFGAVYFGNLDDGTKVAVKVISSSSSQGSREFEAEVMLLTRVHHRNLVRLLGYCDEKQNLSLVYEYMDNGNLRDHLSGALSNGSLLNWKQRVSVALQAAQGLDYLHNGCRPPIIHRDIKSSNILLNSQFVAKISDFGLSRDFAVDATHITTAVAGTPGYLDPEYFQNGGLNEKSDVYSFGIVLLEILTGQSPYQKSEQRTHIVSWVRSRLETGDIDGIIDSQLQGDFAVNAAWNLVEVALSCTSTTSQERIAMSDVVTQLKKCMDKEESLTLSKEVEFSQVSTNPYMSGEATLSFPSAR
ncbi:putative LRR receptor-like serine/threonine-protein kinase At1g05700 isoform X2 [Wolffia australiana]